MRTVVIGGTSGIGLEVARARAARGDDVVLTGRDAGRAAAGGGVGRRAVTGLALDLNDPHGMADALAGVERVDRLVVLPRSSATRTPWPTTTSTAATRLAVLKLVGYTEVVHALLPRMDDDSSVVLFGGRAKDRPYPGSITVSTRQRRRGRAGQRAGAGDRADPGQRAAPRDRRRQPVLVGRSQPACSRATCSRTPTGRLATMADIVGRRRLPAREPRRQRDQPLRRRRLAGDVSESLRVARSSAPGGWGRPWPRAWPAPGTASTVWNRTRAKAEEVAAEAEAAVVVAATAREAAADADVVIVSLADDAAVRAAYGGDDGLLAGLGTGTVVADTSTVAPETVRAMAADVARHRGGSGRHTRVRQRLERPRAERSW